MLICAFDPGPHCGLALYNGQNMVAETYTCDTDASTASTSASATNANRREQYEAIRQVFSKLTTSPDTDIHLVCELYRSLHVGVANSASGVATARLCGWIEGLALLANFPLHWQTPSARVAYIDQARAFPHTSKHEVDAMAHALCAYAALGRVERTGEGTMTAPGTLPTPTPTKPRQRATPCPQGHTQRVGHTAQAAQAAQAAPAARPAKTARQARKTGSEQTSKHPQGQKGYRSRFAYRRPVTDL